MKYFNILICNCFLITACKHEQTKLPKKVSPTTAIETKKENTPKVIGIGGIFFKSEDPTEMKAWYSKNLGLAVDDFGAPFEFRNANNPEEVNFLNWDAFPDTTDYFSPSTKEFMINYRVQNLEELVAQLKANKVTIVDEMASYEYGKFIHILDAEGNKIELWEPVDTVLAKFGRKTNK